MKVEDPRSLFAGPQFEARPKNSEQEQEKKPYYQALSKP